MEVRKITVVSGNMSKKVIESSATTLGELKADLRQNDINYEGKSIFEGLTKVELKDDSSILPRDVERNGQVTNNLVIMLSTSNKKIKSGTMTRAEAYDKIREFKLQDEVMKKFGRNFTMCKTVDLISVIESVRDSIKEVPTAKPCDCVEEVDFVDESLRESFGRLVNHLYEEDIIETGGDLNFILQPLQSHSEEDEKADSVYSSEEINDMFGFLD